MLLLIPPFLGTIKYIVVHNRFLEIAPDLVLYVRPLGMTETRLVRERHSWR
jgi:hypothetical protein